MIILVAVFVAGMPEICYAGVGEPDYDPVFYYYHSDHLGSSEIMTDRQGDLVQHYGYYPFGDERWSENDDAFSVSNRYTSQILDEDTGLYYYGARYYDPELGRFIQADPIVPGPDSSQAFNRYSYVMNNPLKFVDPTGNGAEFPSPFIPWSITPKPPTGLGAAIIGAAGVGGPVAIATVTPMVIGANALFSTASGSSWSVPSGSVSSGNWLGKIGSYIGGFGYEHRDILYSVLIERAWSLFATTNPNLATTISQATSDIQQDYDSMMYFLGSYGILQESSGHPMFWAVYLTLGNFVGTTQVAEALGGIDPSTGEVLSDYQRAYRGGVGLGKMIVTGVGLFYGFKALTSGGSAGSLAERPDVTLKGGRGGVNVKSLQGPPNSIVKGSNGRIYYTNSRGQVIMDITSTRAKPVITGQGFGPKRPPTPAELKIIEKFHGTE